MDEMRIYVASLSDYNAGELLGAWIDCEGKDADELQDEVSKILRASKHPNVTVEDPDTGKQVPSAEEYAIHDHEGFGSLVGEYTPLSEVADIVEAIESADNAGALIAYADDLGDFNEAVNHFEEAYCGEWDSEVAYAEDFVDSCYTLEDPLAMYFDYEAFARDLFMDYTSLDAPSGIYVFRNY